LACQAQARIGCEQSFTCRRKDFSYPSVDACIATMSELCSEMERRGASLAALLGPGAADCFEKQATLGPFCRTPPTVTEADIEAARAA